MPNEQWMEDQSKGWKLLTSSLWCSSKCLASQDIYNKIHDNFVEICPNSWKVITNYHEAKKIVEMCQYFLNNNNNNNNLSFFLLKQRICVEYYLLFRLLFQMKILPMHPNKLITHPLLQLTPPCTIWAQLQVTNGYSLVVVDVESRFISIHLVVQNGSWPQMWTMLGFHT
jgi:hypothetical protein